ncbi:MAG: hypothetical protein Q7K40_03410 [bacterium]|nr:hypothetical protein [bacterium]
MDHIFQHYKKTGYLHHAHVIEGAHDTLLPLLVSALEKNLGIESKGNPDFAVKFFESLGVDEARELKVSQTRASFADARKIFIIGANSFTHEAQNALLKTFEEPTEGTHFFIILPRAEMLLPTLRSRVLVVSGAIESTDDTKALALQDFSEKNLGGQAEKFLNASLEDRFAIAKKLAEKKVGETIDREVFRSLLDNIERILYSRTVGMRDDATANIFREVFQAKTYLADRGSSPKMLLEHLAMIL